MKCACMLRSNYGLTQGHFSRPGKDQEGLGPQGKRCNQTFPSLNPIYTHELTTINSLWSCFTSLIETNSLPVSCEHTCRAWTETELMTRDCPQQANTSLKFMVCILQPWAIIRMEQEAGPNLRFEK